MRVLVVEDELKMASLVRRGLAEEGHVADVAASGEDALWMAEAHPYDAIVLDVVLPGLDGFDTCRELRKAGVWSPVLMLTARDSVGDRVDGLDAGADDYLTKPFSFAELFARLRALARRGGVERPTELVVGDLRLDPASRRVWRGGTEVPLSPKEFALLETFMRRPGQTLSRLQLIEHAWDFAYENRSNVIDVYVRYLREKVDRPFGEESLETVRGVGYRLRDAMSRIPIRIRLTLFFAAAMAIVLAAVGLFVYMRVASDLDARTRQGSALPRAGLSALVLRAGALCGRLGSADTFAERRHACRAGRRRDPAARCPAAALAVRARPRHEEREVLRPLAAAGAGRGRPHARASRLTERRARRRRHPRASHDTLDEPPGGLPRRRPDRLLLMSLGGYLLAGAALRPDRVDAPARRRDLHVVAPRAAARPTGGRRGRTARTRR